MWKCYQETKLIINYRSCDSSPFGYFSMVQCCSRRRIKWVAIVSHLFYFVSSQLRYIQTLGMLGDSMCGGMIDEDIANMETRMINSKDKIIKTIRNCCEWTIDLMTILQSNILTPEIMKKDGEKRSRKGRELWFQSHHFHGYAEGL